MSDKERAVSLHNQGKSIRDISAELGISKSKVGRWLQGTKVSQGVPPLPTSVPQVSQTSTRAPSIPPKVISELNVALRELKKALPLYVSQGVPLAYIIGGITYILQNDTKVYNLLGGAIHAYMEENGLEMPTE